MGLLIVLGLGAAIAAWLSTGTKRIAYAGWQMGIAIFMTILQKPHPVTELDVIWSRFVGIVLGVSDENGPVRALARGQHFGERELLHSLKRQFNAIALESTTLLALDKDAFDALAQNSLTLGYLLSRSSVQYLTLDERKAIVHQVSQGLRQKQVADFMRTNPTVVHETDSVRSALKIFKQAAASMLPVVNEDQRCKGWLRRISFSICCTREKPAPTPPCAIC